LQTKIYFDTISLKEKILLLLIPIMIIILYIIYKPTKYIKVNQNINNKKIYSQIEIINYFEKYVKLHKIEIQSINFANKILGIKLYADINNIVKFIDYTYLKYKIIAYSINSNNKYIMLDIKFNLNKDVNYKRTKTKRYDLKNPFSKIRSKNKKLSKAIIGEYVLINNRWYKKGDLYKNKTIVNIYKDKIELKEDNKISILKVFDE